MIFKLAIIENETILKKVDLTLLKNSQIYVYKFDLFDTVINEWFNLKLSQSFIDQKFKMH